MKKLRLLILLMTVIWAVPSLAQISIGGTPPSFMYETMHKALQSAISLPIDFDVAAMRDEDVLRDAAGMPPRVGTIIPVNNLTTENSGEWSTLPNGQHIWRLSITAKDAIAIMLTYDKFEIPAGGKLFIYNEERSRVLGAYTEANNPKRVEYATEFVPGDRIILEYAAPAGDNFSSPIVLTGVVYGYNNLYVHSEGGQARLDFGGSEPCMINVNCSEGNNWKDEKQGVVRIVTQMGGNSYALCSGSMINNTARDLDPLFLSAWHCYDGKTPAQINQTVYYFKYEHPTCEGRSNPDVPTITGATILAQNQIVGGSDGILLRLNEGNQQFFINNGIYFNGWDRRNTAATSGVGIHHPKGDVKKISTFTSTVVSTYVNVSGHGQSASNAMWRVSWAATANGRSVTQPGSSGSPLFNQNKRIVGTLCAGSSDCDNTTGQDFYGKLWYHWDRPSNQNQWMKLYLDPIDSGEEYIDGTYIAGNKIQIVVSADNKQMQEGDAVPVLTTTITGNPQGTHTFADIVSATVTTSAGSASPAGTYAIVVSSTNLMPDDYVITNVNGVLTVTCTPLNLPLQESFDNTTFPPNCWFSQSESNTPWKRATSGTNPTCSPRSGAGMLHFDSWTYTSGSKGLLITPKIAINNANFELKFWMYRDNVGQYGGSSYTDRVNVYLSDTPSVSGLTPVRTIHRCRDLSPVESANGWYEYITNLSAGSMSAAYIIIEGVSARGNNIYLDDIVIAGESSDATLSSLTVSAGTLTPTFNPNTTAYTVNVANSVASITISATANHTAATVTGAGVKTLNVGANTFTITVTAENGTTQRTYTVVVNRALSNDANLSSLTVSEGTLTPNFSSTVTNYTVIVENSVASLTISATANHTAATVTGAGVKSLNVGANTFTITVTAENGTTQKTYSVIVTRKNLPIQLTAFTLNNGAAVTVLPTVTLDYTFVGLPTHYIASENEDFTGASWTPYSLVINYYTLTSATEGKKKIYSKLKDDFDETTALSREILYKAPHPKPPPAPQGLNVSLYPNPAKTTLNIHIEEEPEQPVSVSIYSLSGQLYLSQNFHASVFSIDLSPYPSGLLLVKISSGNQSVIKQVLKD